MSRLDEIERTLIASGIIVTAVDPEPEAFDTALDRDLRYLLKVARAAESVIDADEMSRFNNAMEALRELLDAE